MFCSGFEAICYGANKPWPEDNIGDNWVVVTTTYKNWILFYS